MMKVIPLLWTHGPDPQPAHPELFAALNRYAEEQFGSPRDFKRYIRVWVLADVNQDGTILKIEGYTTAWSELTVTSHITPPENPLDKEQVQTMNAKRALLEERMKGYLEDAGITEVMAYVERESLPLVREHMKRHNAKPLHMFRVEI